MKSFIFAILICLGFSDAFAQGFLSTRRLDFKAQPVSGSTLPPSGLTNFLVQNVLMNSQGTSASYLVGGTNFAYFRLPNYTGAANAAVLFLTFQDGDPAGSNVTAVINTNLGGASGIVLKRTAAVYDSTQGAWLESFAITNLPYGCNNIVCSNGNGPSDELAFFMGDISEYRNVTTIDTSVAWATNSTTNVVINTVSVSTTNDLILHFTVNDSYQGAGTGANPLTNVIYAAQTGLNWSGVSCGESLLDWDAFQVGMYSNSTTFSPAIIMAPKAYFLSIAVALHTSQGAGTALTGEHIIGLQHINTSQINVPTTFLNSNVLQSVFYGDCQVIGHTCGATNARIGSITGGSWVESTLTPAYNSANPTWCDYWYQTNNTSPGLEKYTILYDSVSANATIMLYDIVGAAAQPYDTASNTNLGSQTVFAATLNMGSMTPSQSSGELILAQGSQSFNTATNFTVASTIMPNMNFYDNEPESGPQLWDQNNPFGSLVTTSGSTLSFIACEWTNNLPVGDWSFQILGIEHQ